MKFITKFIVCTLCFLYLPSLFANQCELKMSETSVKRDVSTSLHKINIISEKDFISDMERSETDADYIGEYGYFKFQNNKDKKFTSRHELFKLADYKMKRDSSLAYYLSAVTPEARKAYVACLQNKTKNGFSVVIEKATPDDIILRLLWLHNEDSPRVLSDISMKNLSGGSLDLDSEMPTSLTHNVGKLVKFARTLNNEFSVIFSAKNKSDVAITVEPPYVPPANRIFVRARAWAGSDSWEKAKTRYSSGVWIREIPQSKEKETIIFSGRHAGPLSFRFYIYPDTRIQAQIRSPHALKGAKTDSPRLYDKSKVSLTGCGTRIPCNYYMSVEKLKFSNY